MTTKNETQGVVSVQCFLMRLQEHATSLCEFIPWCAMRPGRRQEHATYPQRKDEADVAGPTNSKHNGSKNNATHGAFPSAFSRRQERLGPTAFCRPERVHERVVLSFKVCPA